MVNSLTEPADYTIWPNGLITARVGHSVIPHSSEKAGNFPGFRSPPVRAPARHDHTYTAHPGPDPADARADRSVAAGPRPAAAAAPARPGPAAADPDTGSVLVRRRPVPAIARQAAGRSEIFGTAGLADPPCISTPYPGFRPDGQIS
ncbi:hypothetical protein GCM10027436_26900 [Actinophytocola sediminis]